MPNTPNTLGRFAIYTATFTDLASSATSFSQIHGSEVMPGQTVDQEIPGGSIDRVWSMLAFAEGKGGLRTFDIYRALDTVGLVTGLACDAAVLRGRRRADGGTFASGNVHATFTSSYGWLGIQSISVRQRQAAEAVLQYWALYDTSAKPWVFSKTGAASGVVAPTANTRYYMGPVYLNGTELADIQGVEILPGKNYQVVDGSGDLYPKSGTIMTRTPEFRLLTPNLDLINQISAFYLTTGTNLDIYLRKGVEGDDGRVANATDEHIRIRASSSSLQPQDVRGSGNDDYQTGITIIPNGQIEHSVSQALP